MNSPRVDNEPGPRELLAVYLRDHLAGAMAGVALVRRCRRSNDGTALGLTLQRIEAEIVADRDALQQMMQHLDVRKSRLKQLLGMASELIGRLKRNGHLFRYSPSSRVVELELLVAGVSNKRCLWKSLRAVADDYAALDVPHLDQLISRATRQYETLLDEHDRAAVTAFATMPAGSRK